MEGEAVGENEHVVLGGPVEPTHDGLGQPLPEKKQRVRPKGTMRVVTGSAPTSVAALVALLGECRLVGMTRAQRQAQIPAPNVVVRPREEARAKRRAAHVPERALDLACREVRRRAALLAPAFPKPEGDRDAG